VTSEFKGCPIYRAILPDYPRQLYENFWGKKHLQNAQNRIEKQN
jgi:hypothetical protein